MALYHRKFTSNMCTIFFIYQVNCNDRYIHGPSNTLDIITSDIIIPEYYLDQEELVKHFLNEVMSAQVN